MFKKMRKIKLELTSDQCEDILNQGVDGVLGTLSENGYPYTTPVNYVYDGNAIYFHSALKGHKIENIMNYPKVSFTVVTKNKVLQEEFSTDFESVIVFGTASLIPMDKAILMKLITKYSPAYLAEGKTHIEESFHQTQLVKITIDHITGKARKTL